MHVVFVYGTLTDPPQVSTLLDEYTFGPGAVCHGLRRADGQYPTLAPGDSVAGRLLATPEIDRLDRYEGVDRGLYCRHSVPLRSSTRVDQRSAFDVDTAAVYVGNPTTLDVSKDIDWPNSGSFERRVGEYIEANEVYIEIGPTTDDP